MDVEGDVEGFALGLVVGFIGASAVVAEVGEVVPLRAVFETPVRLLLYRF